MNLNIERLRRVGPGKYWVVLRGVCGEIEAG